MITRKKVSYPLMLVLIGLVLVLPGCEVDYYQPSDNQGTGSSLFGDSITVPAGFDWATIKTVDINVEVDDQYNGAYFYTVEVLDGNPIFDEDANLLSKGVAKMNNDFTASIVVAADVETVFIKQIDPAGYEKVTAASINENPVASVSFILENPVAETRSADAVSSVASSASSLSSRSAPANVQTTYTTPANAIEINENTPNGFNLTGHPAYVVRGTYTGELTFPGTGNVALYVEGTWNNTASSITLQDQTKLIIQNGGEFKISKDLTINGNNFVILAVAPTGKFNENKGGKITLNFTNNGQIVNQGLLNAHNLALPSSGLLYNAGEAHIDKFSFNSAENNVTNDGLWTISEASLTNGRIENTCRLIIDQLSTNGAKFTLSEGSLFEVNTYSSAGGTVIDMGSHSIMRVLNSVTFTTQKNTINGNGGEKALLQMEKMVSSGWQGVTFKGNLEIENSNYTGGESGKGYVLISPASWVKKGESTLIIPGTECNEGGVNNVEHGTPANPVFPIIFDGPSLTYLFEDNWPFLGDYDMNDLVLDVEPVYSLNSSNKVTELKLDVTLRAVGATKRLAVGIQLDGISPAMISAVSRTSTAGVNGNVFSESNGLEAGQAYAVIPVFDDAHLALGSSTPMVINTVKGSGNNAAPIQAGFTIAFENPVDLKNISVDKFNAFIVNGGYQSKRQEVHMPGFQPTGKADAGKFGKFDDNSLESLPYTSSKNMIWGLAIPGPAKYAVEWSSITDSYPEFERWAATGGKENKDWYKNPVGNKIYE